MKITNPITKFQNRRYKALRTDLVLDGIKKFHPKKNIQRLNFLNKQLGSHHHNKSQYSDYCTVGLSSRHPLIEGQNTMVKAYNDMTAFSIRTIIGFEDGPKHNITHSKQVHIDVVLEASPKQRLINKIRKIEQFWAGKDAENEPILRNIAPVEKMSNKYKIINPHTVDYTKLSKNVSSKECPREQISQKEAQKYLTNVLEAIFKPREETTFSVWHPAFRPKAPDNLEQLKDAQVHKK